MLIEEFCPKCQGPATFAEGRVCCSLCGVFSDDGVDCLGPLEGVETEVQSVSLLFPSPETAKTTEVAIEFGQAPEDFPREVVRCTVPESLMKAFGPPHEDEFSVKTGHAMEFFFNYVECYGGLPQIELVSHGEEVDVELLSSHAYRLSKLAELVDKSRVWLCDFALLLYAQFLEDKESGRE